MELCSGGNFLDKIIKNNIVLNEEEAAVQLVNIIKAIVHCHSSNIAHRDIKPDNIMIGDEGQIKLVDFGFAVMLK